MMVMTTVSERPVTEPAGTIGALVRLRADLRVRPWPSPAAAVEPAGGCRARAAGAAQRMRRLVVGDLGPRLRRQRAWAALWACQTIRTWPSCSSMRGALVWRIS